MIPAGGIAFLAFGSSPVALAGYAIACARRARKRNAADLCGHCASRLYAPRAFEGPSFVEGHFACAPCAAKSRRRFSAALATAAAITASGTVVGVVAVVTAGPTMGLVAWSAPMVAICELGLMFGGAVAWMKRRNRRALLAMRAQQMLLHDA